MRWKNKKTELYIENYYGQVWQSRDHTDLLFAKVKLFSDDKRRIVFERDMTYLFKVGEEELARKWAERVIKYHRKLLKRNILL